MTQLLKNVHKATVASALIYLLSPVLAFADSEVTALAPPIGAADVIHVSSGLVFVVAAIMLAGFLYSRSRAVPGTDNSVIKVIASRPLGAKEKILLLDVANKQLLIGVTASHLRTLHVFDEAVVDTTQAPPADGFAKRLKSVIRGNQQ